MVCNDCAFGGRLQRRFYGHNKRVTVKNLLRMVEDPITASSVGAGQYTEAAWKKAKVVSSTEKAQVDLTQAAPL